jgi:hypothetical protein
MCRLTNELNRDEITYKADIHPSELSNLMKSETFSHLNRSNAKADATLPNNPVSTQQEAAAKARLDAHRKKRRERHARKKQSH